MTAASAGCRVTEQLEVALRSGKLPGEAQARGLALFGRLTSPVRLAILGLRNSGKSYLFDALAGSRVVPAGLDLPSIELVHARKDRVRMTLAYGGIEERPGHSLDGVALDQLAFVRFEAPLPVLERISLLEVVADDEPGDLFAATRWAARRADVLMWCTGEFGPLERAAWNLVPDALKDHAFLVLSGADRLKAAGQLDLRMSLLAPHARDDFHKLVAVEADGGNGSDLPGGGAAGLRASVLAHVERGRREDFDNALLFLNRYKSFRTDGEPAAARNDVSELVPRGGPAAAGAPSATDGVKPDHGANGMPARAEPLSPVREEAESTGAVVADALALLRERADALCARLDAGGDGLAETILADCLAAIEIISDRLADANVADDLRECLAEAADLMLLLQLERTEAATADSVTLLLQVRRDLEQELAA